MTAPGAPFAPPLASVIEAPTQWCVIDFISDLHLQSAEPATVQAWARYLANTCAQAVFILGDLFEVWVGDDTLDASQSDNAQAHSFESDCAAILRQASKRLNLFVMRGNRDFLLGPAFASATSTTLIEDPSLLVFHGDRWLLSHGDAWCLDDHDYMRFRALARSADWQNRFLAQPLDERRALGQDMRAQSEARKRQTTVYADVDADTARSHLRANQSLTLIHGHTHRPARHDLGHGLQRVVLSDWDARAQPPRTEVLRLQWRAGLTGAGVDLQRLDAAQAGQP